MGFLSPHFQGREFLEGRAAACVFLQHFTRFMIKVELAPYNESTRFLRAAQEAIKNIQAHG
jgi:hypothetical protein